MVDIGDLGGCSMISIGEAHVREAQKKSNGPDLAISSGRARGPSEQHKSGPRYHKCSHIDASVGVAFPVAVNPHDSYQ
jgi:hypothetical protein